MTTYDNVSLDKMVCGIVLNDLPLDVLVRKIDFSGWTLRLAENEEIQICSKKIRGYCNLPFFGRPRQEAAITSSGNGFRSEFTDDASRWRYAVIEPTMGAKLNGSKFSEAAKLSEVNLAIELWLIKTQENKYSVGGSPGQCIQYLMNPPDDESIAPFNYQQLSEVVALRAAFKDELYPTIVKSIAMFRSLDVIPVAPIKTLGYFSVLESLLSHAPGPNDSADSITRQLKRNLILLNNRMDTAENLGFSEFKSTSPDRVISKLYDLRSAIAHGGDFDKKLQDLSLLLTTKLNVHIHLWFDCFLRKIIKRVLVHALKEPQLIIDLKG